MARLILALLLASQGAAALLDENTYYNILPTSRSTSAVWAKGTANGDQVQISNTASSGNAIQWIFTPANRSNSSNTFYISNRVFPDYRLDIQLSTGDNHPYLARPDDTSNSQRWNIEKLNDGHFRMSLASAIANTTSLSVDKGSDATLSLTTGDDKYHQWLLQAADHFPATTTTPTPSSSTPMTESSDNNKHISTALIVAITTSTTLAFLLLIGGVCFLLWRRRRQQQEKARSEKSPFQPYFSFYNERGGSITEPKAAWIEQSWEATSRPAYRTSPRQPAELVEASTPVELWTSRAPMNGREGHRSSYSQSQHV